MSNVTHPPNEREQFERLLFINQQMLAFSAALYRQHGVMMIQFVRYVNPITNMIGVVFHLMGPHAARPNLAGFKVHITSGEPERFIRTCFLGDAAIMESAVSFKGKRPAKPAFFTELVDLVAQLLQRIEAAPEEFPVVTKTTEAEGYVKKIVAIQERAPMERYYAVFDDGTGVPVEKLAEQAMPVCVGGYVYTDGQGHAEFFHAHLLH